MFNYFITKIDSNFVRLYATRRAFCTCGNKLDVN